MSEGFSIPFPRRVLRRSAARLLGRALMALFTRTTITGREHLPKEGPLILVGNHVAVMEVVLMVLYSPWLVEVLGTADIPLDPAFAFIINSYGMIPINRGSMDRSGMNMALDVLRQKGVVGIFPEGGVWDTSLRQGRTGVAWLSSKANAPIVPMGFGGTEGALGAILRLKRPRLTMNIGPVIPPIQVEGKGRKEALEAGANLVMERIEALIPEEDKRRRLQVVDEHFDFEWQLVDAQGQPVNPGGCGSLSQPQALGQFFYRPMILNTLARNLRLPVQPLQQLASDPQQIADATQAVLTYLEANPYFLSYRFGYETGGAMQTGLTELRDIARCAAANGYSLALNPIRRYRRPDSAAEIIESGASRAHHW